MGPGQRRGDSIRGAVEGDYLGVGELPGFSDGGGASRRGNQPGVPRAADSVSALRAGRRVDGARGHARGDGAGRGAVAGGGRRGRVRIFDDDLAATYRLPGAAAGVQAGIDRRAEGIRQRAAGRRARRDRNRAHAARGTYVGGRAGIAGIPARRKSAAGHLARDGEPPRQTRGQRRHAAAARAADQARRRAPGAVQAVRRADGFAQSVFVRRHGAVGAGVQSAAREAEGVLSQSRISRRLSRGVEEAASVPGQMESGRGARDCQSRAADSTSARRSAKSPSSATRIRSTPSSTSRSRTI